MLSRFAIFVSLLTVASLTGCGGYIQTEAGQQIDVSGIVNGPDSKPLNNVMIHFQATGGAAQGVNFPVKDGKFSGKMNAGKYTYYLGGEGPKMEAALKSIPQTWKAGSLDRQIDVKAGDIPIKF